MKHWFKKSGVLLLMALMMLAVTGTAWADEDDAASMIAVATEAAPETEASEPEATGAGEEIDESEAPEAEATEAEVTAAEAEEEETEVAEEAVVPVVEPATTTVELPSDPFSFWRADGYVGYNANGFYHYSNDPMNNTLVYFTPDFN